MTRSQTGAAENNWTSIGTTGKTKRMKLRQLLASAALFTLLLATGPVARAEEANMNMLQTALGSTTISGYVDTSVEWTPGNQTTVQAPPSHGFGSWWRTFRMWLRAHGRR